MFGSHVFLLFQNALLSINFVAKSISEVVEGACRTWVGRDVSSARLRVAR